MPKTVKFHFLKIQMVHWSSQEDVHNHTKNTEETLAGINPQAALAKITFSLHVWIIIITMIFPTALQRLSGLWQLLFRF